MIRSLSFSLLLAAATAPAARAADASPATGARASPGDAVQEVRLVVDGGYRPNRIEVQAGRPIRLVIVRRDYTPCTKELVLPKLGLRRALPVNEEVVIELPAQPEGEVEFHCGMKMVRGKLVVLPRP